MISIFKKAFKWPTKNGICGILDLVKSIETFLSHSSWKRIIYLSKLGQFCYSILDNYSILLPMMNLIAKLASSDKGKNCLFCTICTFFGHFSKHIVIMAFVNSAERQDALSFRETNFSALNTKFNLWEKYVTNCIDAMQLLKQP